MDKQFGELQIEETNKIQASRFWHVDRDNQCIIDPRTEKAGGNPGNFRTQFPGFPGKTGASEMIKSPGKLGRN